MECQTGLMLKILATVRLCFERTRDELGGDTGAQPRQAPVLGMLARSGEMSQAELARALNVTAATVAVSVARLEKLGFVAKRQNEDNRRANVIALTERGHVEARRVCGALDRVSAAALKGISEEERALLRTLFERITENLNAAGRAGRRDRADDEERANKQA